MLGVRLVSGSLVCTTCVLRFRLQQPGCMFILVKFRCLQRRLVGLPFILILRTVYAVLSTRVLQVMCASSSLVTFLRWCFLVMVMLEIRSLLVIIALFVKFTTVLWLRVIYYRRLCRAMLLPNVRLS